MKLELDELVKQDVINLSYKYSLSNDDLDVLCPAIEKSTVLHTLKLGLGDNKLTLADGKLANAIAKNTTLKVLDLHNNKIVPEGMKQLADALKKNNTLQELDLSKNKIGGEGAGYIADMLAVNETLQELDLSNNKIGFSGTKKLTEALEESNHSIKQLWLGGNNNISSSVSDRMNVVCKKNEIIVTLKQSIAKKDKELEDKEIAKISRVNAKQQEGEETTSRLIRAAKDAEADTTRQDEETEKKEQEVKSKVGDIVRKDKENERLKKELADAQRELVTAKQMKDTAIAEKEGALKSITSMKADITRKEEEINSKDTDIANRDQQLESALQAISKRDKDITKKNKQLEQLASIKMILNPAAIDDDDEPSSSKRARTGDTSMEVWDKDTPRMMTRHQNQMNRASEKPIVKFENKVMGFKRCPLPQCNTMGLFTKGCSIVTCRMSLQHNGKFHHFCFYCGKSASDPGDSCNNGVCPYKIDEESRKLYQDNLDKAFMEFSRHTRQAGGAYDVDKV